jgi:hypothetical protein
MRSRLSRIVVLVALFATTAGLVPALTSQPKPAAAATTAPGIPVMGPSRLTAVQLANWYLAQHRSPHLPVTIQELASYYIWEGALEGVRGDIAFAQSVVETGFFEFVGSMVKPENFNYAGMGACDSCNSGRQFPSAQIGVRAQIQHLKNYADPTSRAATLKNPPVVQWYGRRVVNGVESFDPALAVYNFDHFFAKGRAPTWNQMGNGNWATAPSYSTVVLSVYNKMLTFNGQAGDCPPDRLGFGAMEAKACPVALRTPGRAVAAAVGGGYYTLNGDGTVKAYNALSYGSPLFGFDIARDIAVMPDGKGYIVLDGYGGLHKFGSATQGVMGSLAGPYFGFDIARSLAITIDGKGLVELDGYGGIHTVGDVAKPANAPYWPGWDIARSIHVSADKHGFYLLDGFGGVWTLGTATNYGAPYFGFDAARDVFASFDGRSYAVLDAFGAIHTYGPGRRNVGNIGYVLADRWRGLTMTADGKYTAIRNDAYAAAG